MKKMCFFPMVITGAPVDLLIVRLFPAGAADLFTWPFRAINVTSLQFVADRSCLLAALNVWFAGKCKESAL